jgi:DNA-binding transcriptional LysR family regulator
MVFISIMPVAHDGLAGLDLNLLRALDALLAERHVTRAAARLGMTQSAASHALARLRDALGDPLLVRGSRGQMVPTARAETVAGPLRDALAGLARAVHGPPAFAPATATRTFHIATTDYVELVLLPALIARITTTAPGVDLWIHDNPESRGADLETSPIDVAILPRGRVTTAGVLERNLFEEQFVCVMRAGHPLAARRRLTLARFCAAAHLLVAPRSLPGGIVDDRLAALGRSRRVVIGVPHFLAAAHVLARTDLISTLPRRVVETMAPLIGLVAVPPPLELAGFTLGVLWHERHQHDPGHRWLRDQLVAIAAPHS